MDKTWDCIVVGAGAAGLSAAMVLGRARRTTLVIDAGRQSNLPAHGIGGLLGNDTRAPAEFYAAGRAEVANHPSMDLRSGEVVTGEGDATGFVVELADGSRARARRVLLATGMDYRYPDLPGIAERRGATVFHCPSCHGWEVRDQPLGVLGSGVTGVQKAVLLRCWSDDVTLLTHGPADLDGEGAERLRVAGVEVDERPVDGLRDPGRHLDRRRLRRRQRTPARGLLVPVTLHQRSDLATQLGATTAPANPMSDDAVEVDAMSATSVLGLSAARDITVQMPSVASAIAAGHRAAAMIVHSLLFEASAPVAASVGPEAR